MYVKISNINVAKCLTQNRNVSRIVLQQINALYITMTLIVVVQF